MLTHIEGCYCPACGQQRLHRIETGELRCMNDECTNPFTAQRILSDPEIHHIVRFKDYAFNVKHPLRERVEGELLDCPIHAVVQAQVNDGQIFWNQQWHPIGGTWRMKYEPTWLENPEFGGDPFSWERL